MADFNNYQNRAAQTGAQSGAMIDEGLRAYMLKVYNLMALGLAITGIAAFATWQMAVADGQLTPFGQLLFASPLRWVVMLSPLAVVFFLSFRINKMSVSAAQATFWGYAALMGLSLSSIFLVFTGQSIVQTFFVTAASFGALSLYGYTTKRSLSAMGSFLIMGLFGIIIASVVNIFVASSMLQFIVSVVGVLIFAGLTAYDTQRLKNDYIYGYASQGGDIAERAAITGALSLYLNFINLFTLLLQLLGQKE